MFVQKIDAEPGAAQGADDARQRVDPLIGPGRRERDRVATVGMGFVEDQRALGGRVDPAQRDPVDALKRFQSEQSLEPTGKIDSLSLIALGLGPK